MIPSLPSLFTCLILALASLAASSTPTKSQECLAAILDVYGTLLFTGIGYGDYYASVCGNPALVASMYAATNVYCTPKEKQSGIQLWNGYCVEYGPGPVMSESSVEANTTEAAISRMQVINSTADATTTNYTDPVMISEELFRLAYHTEDDWDYEIRTHTKYGFAMYGFWGGVLVFGMLYRLGHVLQQRRAGHSPDNESSNHGKPSSHVLGQVNAWIRKHITTPSILPPYHTQSFFGCTIPTRLEFIVIYLYWVISIVLCAVHYRGFEGNIFWDKIPPQTWRYIADRTGIICYANLPLLWMFSGRNNIFIWLTGWEFSVFNLFHRHIARVATMQAIIHSVSYTVFYYAAGDWESYFLEWKEAWWYLGAMATVAMSFLIFFSFRVFRHKTYEFFLLVHIALSVVTIVGLFYHTSIFEGEYNPYLWPLVAIWLFDRVVRIIRVVYCNVHVRLGSGKTIHCTTATVIHHQVANVLEIQLRPGTKHLNPGPGQHYFLYQPFRLKGWENHPFTLASYDVSAPNSDGTEGLSLSFWARPQSGWTAKLRRECDKSPDSTVKTNLLIEGPYGVAKPLWDFDEVFLIAGGSGIAAVMPYLHDYMKKSEAPQSIRTTLVHFVWTVRNEENVRLLMNGPLDKVLAREDIESHLHITSPHSPLDSASLVAGEKTEEPATPEESMLKELSPSVRPSHQILNLKSGRPDVGSLITTTAGQVSGTGRRLAVFVCGPATLADAARDATRRSMQGDNVRYFEETFGW
ncbi:ferric reductase NAD binding domain-containing protein [Plectosphaerella plurivora]|uniref:Ferric reductase NAD binding domain-containing protein n=1 Tax=Plectosphaerella plurivora TaxID=936078 RepID=A0A9P8VGW9_9PEZI|nr:ferric reductase NAD binding domain-containing protein [Plectosphaerella plurivora]